MSKGNSAYRHQFSTWLNTGFRIQALSGRVLSKDEMMVIGQVKHRNSEHYRLKQKLKGESVDFDGVINNAFHSQELYDVLKKKCHPDRFSTDPELVEKATEIFALIVKNKYNHQSLCELKKKAEKELNIVF